MKRRKPYKGRLQYRGKPRPGSIVVYRWGTNGARCLSIVVAFDSWGVRFKTVVGGKTLESLTGSKKGGPQDGAKCNLGTWRFPNRDEVVKKRGKWCFA